MLRNYVKVAYRNLLKNKMYAFISIAGLAFGMAVALLIALWIYDEFSFNRNHNNLKRIAQVMATQTFNGRTSTAHTTVVPLEKELRTKYQNDFKNISLSWKRSHILASGEQKISSLGRWAQPEFPVMFSLEIEKGNISSFNDPSTLLLSSSLATVLFGDENPVNKVIRVDNTTDMKVGGVYKDLPVNSAFHDTKYLLPWHNSANFWTTQTEAWSNHGCELFVQLAEHALLNQVNQKIENITQEHGYTISNEKLSLHPMDKWHLYTDLKNGRLGTGRIQTVKLFGVIAVFVLLLACINFMNLNTARSEKRAREVGIRKTIGSMRGELIKQFLIESLLITFLALIVTILIVQLSLPLFNSIADKQIHFPWKSMSFWIVTAVFTLFTGFLSGSYPSFYLSSFSPVKVLKGTFHPSKYAALPRKVLVVIQFTVSIALIIGTLIVFRQIQHGKDRSVGYNREGLICIEMNTPEIYRKYNALRSSLIATGVVENMGEANSEPTQVWANNNGFEWKGKDPSIDPQFATIAVTHDYGKTLGWEITKGRDFSRNYTTDSAACILNQSAVKITGLADPVGQVITWKGKSYNVVGVINDIIMDSPYKPILPTIFLVDYYWLRFITLRVRPDQSMHSALSKIEQVFKEYNPASPFHFKFVDEEYAAKFSDEKRIGHLATIFATFAMFISCLGIFGLATFVAEKRNKELGVRKVLGASVFNLWRMLSKDFVLLVVISCFIACPIAWIILNRWLQNFEYRTEVLWWFFVLPGVGAILITLLTVSWQAVKAAMINPVTSLRSQ